MSSPITYQKAGVDPAKAEKILGSFASFLKTRPKNPNVISGIGPFASCFSLKQALSGMVDPVLVTCCDGVGTKLKLALAWNDISGLGQDLVAMNVNDLLCAGAHPLLFLDYYACGELNEAQLTGLLKSIQAGCELASCALVGGETAEMPGLYGAGDFDLAGFSVGMADRHQLLGPSKVEEGDRLLGIASSGFHSNGYSLVRRIAEAEQIDPNDTPSFARETWKQLLLKPTHIYVEALISQLPKIHALAHITGGGLYENLPRVLPEQSIARVQSCYWEFPELFAWIQDKAALDVKAMLSTFNCGVGMIAVVSPSESQAVIDAVTSSGHKIWDLGEVGVDASASSPQVLWD